MRSATITYDVADAWETWYIDITDPNAPEVITPEWLLANRDGWEYFDLKDRGAGEIIEASLEVEDYE